MASINDPGSPLVPLEEPIESIDSFFDYVRGGLNLNEKQRRFLAVRTLYAKNQDACVGAGITYRMFRRWMTDSPENAGFIEAFRRLVEYGPEVLGRALFQDQLGRAALANEEMLAATRWIPQGSDKTLVEKPDWQARGKAVEHVMRATGMWQEKKAESTPADVIAAMADFADAIKAGQVTPSLTSRATTVEGSYSEYDPTARTRP